MVFPITNLIICATWSKNRLHTAHMTYCYKVLQQILTRDSLHMKVWICTLTKYQYVYYTLAVIEMYKLLC